MSITGATAKLTLSQPILFPTPQQIQGFAADDVTDMDPVQIAEILMGVDGFMSSGFVWKERTQGIRLQADSVSNNVFDTINTQSQAVEDTYPLTMTILLSSIGLKLNCSNGVLQLYPPMPAVKRLLQPRQYRIIWNLVTPQLTA